MYYVCVRYSELLRSHSTNSCKAKRSTPEAAVVDPHVERGVNEYTFTSYSFRPCTTEILCPIPKRSAGDLRLRFILNSMKLFFTTPCVMVNKPCLSFHGLDFLATSLLVFVFRGGFDGSQGIANYSKTGTTLICSLSSRVLSRSQSLASLDRENRSLSTFLFFCILHFNTPSHI